MSVFRAITATSMVVFLTLFLAGRARGQFPWQRPVERDPAEVQRIVGPIHQREPSRDLTIVWVWGIDKFHRSSIALATTAAALVLVPGGFVAAADVSETAVDLFDGKSLDGWDYYLVKPDAKMADVWSVRDGLLVCKGEPMGYLATKKEFTNFRLIVEWRWAPGKPPGNSGVLLRITGKPQALSRCVEAQLKAGSAGDIYGFHGFPVQGDPARAVSAQSALFGKLSGLTKLKGNEKEPGEWNQYVITLRGGKLTLVVNGEKVNEATGLDVVAGKIALQSEGGEIHFRTVRLIPLDDQ